ncbi:hypothetical protein BH09PAT3_BH09PAT3_2660 [soil metagenome]
MNLHRANGNDWSTIPAKEQSGWQRLAAKTNGIITPGNLVSIIGCVLVLLGIVLLAKESYGLGILLVLLGRSADLLDGFVANLTKTKSPLGEAVDASIDKFEAFVAVLVLFIKGAIPIYLALPVALHTVFGTVMFLLAQRRSGRLHPGQIGKLATATEWLALAVVVGAAAAKESSFESPLLIFGVILSLSFTVLAIIASYKYIQQYQKIDQPYV